MGVLGARHEIGYGSRSAKAGARWARPCRPTERCTPPRRATGQPGAPSGSCRGGAARGEGGVLTTRVTAGSPSIVHSSAPSSAGPTSPCSGRHFSMDSIPRAQRAVLQSSASRKAAGVVALARIDGYRIRGRKAARARSAHVRSSALPDARFEGIQGELRAQRGRDPPAADAPGEPPRRVRSLIGVTARPAAGSWVARTRTPTRTPSRRQNRASAEPGSVQLPQA